MGEVARTGAFLLTGGIAKLMALVDSPLGRKLVTSPSHTLRLNCGMIPTISVLSGEGSSLIGEGNFSLKSSPWVFILPVVLTGRGGVRDGWVSDGILRVL